MASFSEIIVPVTDLARARDFYRVLTEVDPFVDSEHYVGFMVGEMQIGLAKGNPGPGGPAIYWKTDDIEASQRALVAAGGALGTGPNEVGGGLQVATVTDPDGNTVGLSQPPQG
ncbi:glyoxalase [Gulosibacter macacae]|uniref:Glyoxalase n=1 Tax=Gulosibacter macacae TaxID=2488791 RepID=A0A3P3VYL2_9MICO|nr:VOC family protein [Gulosibacter macacae]RRJ87574.1 glyoxalase [Gulosibacter macacae]